MSLLLFAAEQRSIENFISYSSSDIEMVRIIQRIMLLGGQQVPWTDFDRVTFGANWRDEIRSAIGRCGRYTVCWSRDAAESKSVAWEMNLAFKRPGLKKTFIQLDRTMLPRRLDTLAGIRHGEFERMLRMLNASSGHLAPESSPAEIYELASHLLEILFGIERGESNRS